MNFTSFQEKINNAISLLKNLEIYKYKNLKNLKSFSEEFNKAAMSSEYKCVFQTALDNRDYHILLLDDSFFQFQYGTKNGEVMLTYTYYQNPRSWISYDDFLIEVLEDFSNGDVSRELYEDYLDDQAFGNTYITMRYEYKPCDYNEFIHAASHIHIGFNNNIRIPFDKIITPYMFTIFVIKHIYYKLWMEKIDVMKSSIDREKVSCNNILPKYWTDLEKKELFIA